MGAVAATLASLVVNAPYVGSDLYIVFLDVCTPLFLYSFFIHSLLASPVLRKCVCVCVDRLLVAVALSSLFIVYPSSSPLFT